MIQLLLVSAFLFAGASDAGKTNTPTTVTEVLAKSENVSPPWFEKVKVEKQISSYHLQYYRSHGEGGGENCDVFYDFEGTILSHFCRIHYVSHSMGPGNAESYSQLLRIFQNDGSVKILGNYRKTLLKDKKVVENRSITSLKDEQVSSFTKPVVKMPVHLLEKTVK